MTTFEAPQPRSSLFLGTKRAHSEEAGNVHPSEARSQHTITTLPNLSTSTLVLLFKKVTELLTKSACPKRFIIVDKYHNFLKSLQHIQRFLGIKMPQDGTNATL